MEPEPSLLVALTLLLLPVTSQYVRARIPPSPHLRLHCPGLLRRVGWPRGIAPPGLPQIRACGTPAPGSSGSCLRCTTAGRHASSGPGSPADMSGAPLASSAIRWSLVETVLGLGVPIVFSSSGSMIPAPPFLHGVPWGGFPRLTGTMGCSDSSSPIPGVFGCPSTARYLSRRVLTSLLGVAHPCDPEAWPLLFTGGPTRPSAGGGEEASQVPGEPP